MSLIGISFSQNLDIEPIYPSSPAAAINSAKLLGALHNSVYEK